VHLSYAPELVIVASLLTLVPAIVEKTPGPMAVSEHPYPAEGKPRSRTAEFRWAGPCGRITNAHFACIRADYRSNYLKEKYVPGG
jgi:hypothetical protein